MAAVQFDSSVIAKISVQRGSPDVLITFANGAEYLYEGVGPEIVRGLVLAPSVGAYFNKFVRNNFRAKKLKDKE